MDKNKHNFGGFIVDCCDISFTIDKNQQHQQQDMEKNLTQLNRLRSSTVQTLEKKSNRNTADNFVFFLAFFVLQNNLYDRIA